eukprot:766671-Hanusia_phi.AAC.3
MLDLGHQQHLADEPLPLLVRGASQQHLEDHFSVESRAGVVLCKVDDCHSSSLELLQDLVLGLILSDLPPAPRHPVLLFADLGYPMLGCSCRRDKDALVSPLAPLRISMT